MQVSRTTRYVGGHAQDPGYRFVEAITRAGTVYHFYSDPDGSNIRTKGTMRVAYKTPKGDWRRLPEVLARPVAIIAEPVLKAFLARYKDWPPPTPPAPLRPENLMRGLSGVRQRMETCSGPQELEKIDHPRPVPNPGSRPERPRRAG